METIILFTKALNCTHTVKSYLSVREVISNGKDLFSLCF